MSRENGGVPATTTTYVYDAREEEGYVDDEKEDARCGVACFKPNFLQPLKSMKVFLVVFILAGISQGMFYTYWNMTLSSIEKRFQIPSQTTGIIAAINDVSHIAVVLFVAHFAGRGHRPFWLSMGCLTVGIAVLTFATPELFAPKWEFDDAPVVSSNHTFDKELCLTSEDAAVLKEQCTLDVSQKRGNWPAFVLLGVAQILLGIGTTAPIVLAMPFIDDNVKTKNTPIYFALGFAGRFIGPLIGVFVGSFCLSTYIDLSQSPNIAQNDPRWMGAWYLGFLIIGTLICCVSTLYLFFPSVVPARYVSLSEKKAKSLTAPSSPSKSAQFTQLKPLQNGHNLTVPIPPVKESLKEKLAGIPRDLKRLFVNKIFMCRVMNDCIDMLVVSGYFSFAPKYLEYHFGMSPAKAGKFNGLASILAVAGGATIGGIIIKKLKLAPKHVAAMICVSSFLISVCYFFLMMVKCDARRLHSTVGADQMLNVHTTCSAGCNCMGRPFSPVCDELNMVSYFSPCHAGCSSSFTRDKVQYYGNCTCVVGQWSASPVAEVTTPSWLTTGLVNWPSKQQVDASEPETVRRGFCEEGCAGFWIYVVISTSFKFVGAFPFSGNQMISFRIVDPDLKSLSKAVRTLLASLFAFIPGPIIMGALIDSACKLWNTKPCGGRGACLLYDPDSLRVKMHLYVGVVKTIACVMDLYVFFKVRNMKFDRQEAKQAEEETLETTAAPTGSVRDLTAKE